MQMKRKREFTLSDIVILADGTVYFVDDVGFYSLSFHLS